MVHCNISHSWHRGVGRAPRFFLGASLLGYLNEVLILRCFGARGIHVSIEVIVLGVNTPFRLVTIADRTDCFVSPLTRNSESLVCERVFTARVWIVSLTRFLAAALPVETPLPARSGPVLPRRARTSRARRLRHMGRRAQPHGETLEIRLIDKL